MIKFRKILLVLSLFWVHACKKNADCTNLNSSANTGRFRIINNHHEDLLFGSQAIYKSSMIQFYSIHGNETLFYDKKVIFESHDSLLFVNFYPLSTNPIYVKLSDTDTDTLIISYHILNEKTCGFAEITNFRYNGTDFSGGSYITVNITK